MDRVAAARGTPNTREKPTSARVVVHLRVPQRPAADVERIDRGARGAARLVDQRAGEGDGPLSWTTVPAKAGAYPRAKGARVDEVLAVVSRHTARSRS